MRRVGTQRIRDLLHQLSDVSGSDQTLNEIREMATQVANTSLCGMGQSCTLAELFPGMHGATRSAGACPDAWAIYR